VCAPPARASVRPREPDDTQAKLKMSYGFRSLLANTASMYSITHVMLALPAETENLLTLLIKKNLAGALHTCEYKVSLDIRGFETRKRS
jgi:hypothetical protein